MSCILYTIRLSVHRRNNIDHRMNFPSYVTNRFRNAVQSSQLIKDVNFPFFVLCIADHTTRFKKKKIKKFNFYLLKYQLFIYKTKPQFSTISVVVPLRTSHEETLHSANVSSEVIPRSWLTDEHFEQARLESFLRDPLPLKGTTPKQYTKYFH